MIDIGIGYGQQEIYVPSIPVFLADLPEKRLPGSRRASHGCEDSRKSSGLTKRFIKKKSSISKRKMINKTDPRTIHVLYPVGNSILVRLVLYSGSRGVAVRCDQWFPIGSSSLLNKVGGRK